MLVDQTPRKEQSQEAELAIRCSVEQPIGQDQRFGGRLTCAGRLPCKLLAPQTFVYQLFILKYILRVSLKDLVHKEEDISLFTTYRALVSDLCTRSSNTARNGPRTKPRCCRTVGVLDLPLGTSAKCKKRYRNIRMLHDTFDTATRCRRRPSERTVDQSSVLQPSFPWTSRPIALFAVVMKDTDISVELRAVLRSQSNLKQCCKGSLLHRKRSPSLRWK